jgi:glucans biosynthesis protein
MHGGAHGSGAPKGERNANYRHGFYTAKAIAERRALRALINKLAD